MTELSKRAMKRARGAMRAVKREDTGACKCQSVTLAPTPSGLSFRYVKSRLCTVKTDCPHWLPPVPEHCACQTLMLRQRQDGSHRWDVSRTRAVQTTCAHWHVTDAWTGRLTDQPRQPVIGTRTRHGVNVKRTSKARKSPWNKA